MFDYQYSDSKVSGTLTGPQGQAVSTGVIVAYGTETATRLHVSVMARVQRGKYSFFLAPGEYYVKSDSLPPGLPTFQGVKLTVGGDTTVHLQASGHRVTGRIALGPEEPMSGARVQVGAEIAGAFVVANAVAGSEGDYMVYLPSGNYGLSVWPAQTQRFVSQKNMNIVVEKDEHLDIDMSGVEWRGTVRDSSTREPIDSLVVGACYGSSSRRLAEDVSHSGGTFRLVLRPGYPYSILVTKRDTGTRLLESQDAFATRDTTFNLEVPVPPSLKD